MKKYYITLGSGHPYYPGYFESIGSDENEARHWAFIYLDNRYCTSYTSLDDIHPLDRIYRGTLTEAGISS